MGSEKIEIDKYNDYSLISMLKDFYNRKMLSIIIILFADTLLFMALAIFSAIKFFQTEQTKQQITYAVIFLCCFQLFVLIKIFAWQIIHRNNLKRDIRKLELKLDDLSERIQK